MSTPAFVGRRRELAVLHSAARKAHDGEPQVVVVHGEPGIGKTRVMEHFAAELGDDFRVLRGTCVELGTDGLPLAPVTAVLRELVASDGVAALTALLPGAEALLNLLPELGTPTAGTQHQTRLFDLFGALMQRLSIERPVVLIVDDLHWADRSTRELLGVLARTLRSARVIVLTACRADLPRTHPLRAFLAELDRLPTVRRLELDRFSRAEITELVTGLVADVTGRPSDTVIERVYRRSGGNPYAAEEMAREGGEAALPASLSELLLQRIERLPGSSRHVVQLAAVGGATVPHALLAAVTGVEESELLAAVRSAADAGVLVSAGDGYAFRSALLREAILDDLLPAERGRLHRTFADALESDPRLVEPERLAAQAAFHWYGAGDAAMALPALMRAAGTAERLCAHAERAQMLERALDLWPRVPGAAEIAGVDRLSVFESAVGAATWAGEHLRALDLIDRALTEADRAREPERVAMLLAQRGMTLANLDRDGALTVVDEALQLLPPDSSVLRPRVLDLVSAVLAMRGLPERARPAAAEAAELAGRLGEEWIETNARTTLGWALVQLGRHDEGMTVLRAARDLAQRRDDAVGIVRAELNLGEAARGLGRFDTLIDTARAGLAMAETAGVGRTLGVLLAAQLASGLVATGRWDEAGRTITAAIQLDPPALFGANLHALRAEVASARGDLETARSELSLARTLVSGPGVPSSASLVTSRLEIELALRDTTVTDAGDRAMEAVTGLAPDSSPHDAWPLLTTAAQVAAQVAARHRLHSRVPAHPDSDEPFAEALRAAASHLPVDTPLWSAYAAQFAAEIGADGGSWLDVVAAWDEIGRPHSAAYARLRAAESALAAGDAGAAAPLLRAAGEQARRLGAAPLLDDVTTLARGARLSLGDDASTDGPDRAVPTESVGLTEREAEVLRLIMQGRTNRQIGAELFISPKTVSVHVSNLLPKLGAASRGEAVAAAHRLHLFPADE